MTGPSRNVFTFDMCWHQASKTAGLGFLFICFLSEKIKLGIKECQYGTDILKKKSYMDRRARERNMSERYAQLGLNLFVIGLFSHFKAEFS